jgi:hypothetical protein
MGVVSSHAYSDISKACECVNYFSSSISMVVVMLDKIQDESNATDDKKQ